MTWIIHAGSPVDQPVYLSDADGNAVPIDVTGQYRCAIKRTPLTENIVLEFETDGSPDIEAHAAGVFLRGGIEIVRDYFRFTATAGQTTGLAPGAYVTDLIRLDAPMDWKFDVKVTIKPGITPR